MKSILENHRILLVGGPGGVGKTTTAAIIGIQLAQLGYKTIVLTVDPAMRLAQALGFSSFPKDIQPVDIAQASGKLWASMLDQQRYFDRVIEKFATTPEQKERVLSHPIYRTMVSSLGGTQEYAAMERLLEFSKDSGYDKIVVDTPPTQNASDLLSAPKRLAEFMDNSVLRWFSSSGKRTGKILQRGTKMAMKLLQSVLGAEFLSSFSELVDQFEGMQAGFRERHLEVVELLRSPVTAFFLVTYPSEARFLETKDFLQTLREHEIALKGLILNRLEPPYPEQLTNSLSAVDDGAKEKVTRMLNYFREFSEIQSHWRNEFATLLPELPSYAVQRQVRDIHDIEILSQLGKELVC